MSNSNYIELSEKVLDSFQAFLVKDAKFTSNEEYPILRKEMISTELLKKIMPFDKAIIFQGNLSDTYICFFTADEKFERVRKNPKKYLNFFKRTAGIIGFDFSIHSDMTVVKQKSQMNDNLSITYYYGNEGIKIIPNIRTGINELNDEFYSAIPKHSMIAVGTHGFIKTKPEQAEWYCCLEEVIEKLQPSTIIVYGTLSNKMFDKLKGKADFVFYDAWIVQRRKAVIANGDKRGK